MEKKLNIKNKVAVLDGDGLIWACCFGVKLLDQNNEPIKVDGKFTYRDKTEEEVYQALDNLLHGILTKTESTSYVLYIKGKNTIKDRKEINIDYKSNRKAEVPTHYNIAKWYLIDNWQAIECNNLEADDAVNITRLNLKDSFIVAVDNDLLALETRNGMPHYNWRKQESFHVNAKEAAFKFWSDAICGQKGDGLCGILGKGIVYTKKQLLGEGMLDYNYKLYPQIVLRCYIDHYGEDKGIKEFYKTYHCLKILDFFEGFIIPEPIEYIIPVIETKEELPEFDF